MVGYLFERSGCYKGFVINKGAIFLNETPHSGLQYNKRMVEAVGGIHLR